MYGRVVTYTYSEDRELLTAKARAEAVPLVTGTPGNLAYAVMVLDDQVVSVSAWESEDHAKAGDAAILEWVNSGTTLKVASRTTGDFAWFETNGV